MFVSPFRVALSGGGGGGVTQRAPQGIFILDHVRSTSQGILTFKSYVHSTPPGISITFHGLVLRVRIEGLGCSQVYGDLVFRVCITGLGFGFGVWLDR